MTLRAQPTERTTEKIMNQSLGLNPLLFLAASLACFRLTRLITDDKIFDWLRELVIREAPRALKTKAKQGITCPFCVSFYFAVLIAGFLVCRNMVLGADAPLWGAAIWGGSILFNQIFVKLSE